MSNRYRKANHDEKSIRSITPFSVRLDAQLRTYLQRAANRNHDGSLQQEIVNRLIQSMTADLAGKPAGDDRTQSNHASAESAVSH